MTKLLSFSDRKLPYLTFILLLIVKVVYKAISNMSFDSHNSPVEQVWISRFNSAQGNLTTRMWRSGGRSLHPFPEFIIPEYTVHCDPIILLCILKTAFNITQEGGLKNLCIFKNII